MRREWKPGDVAMVTDRSGSEEIAFCYRGGITNNGTGDETARWRVAGGDVWSSISNARPLLVIDPEDAESVERLMRALWKADDALFGRRAVDEWVPMLAAALRSLLAPPKPDEPTGLGAVVEDAEHRKWVRHDNAPGSFPWVRAGHGVSGWSDIDAVRVLSEGVIA